MFVVLNIQSVISGVSYEVVIGRSAFSYAIENWALSGH
jgi:hypothetical protein